MQYSYPFAPIQSLFAGVLRTKPVSERAAGKLYKSVSGRALNRPRSPEVRKPLVCFLVLFAQRKKNKTVPFPGSFEVLQTSNQPQRYQLRTKQIKSFWNFPRFIKPCFSIAKLQLPTAPKLTCSNPFRMPLATVSLHYKQSFFEKYQSCVSSTATHSHRFKAFTPAFCRQNRFRHVPSEFSAKLLPAEL